MLSAGSAFAAQPDAALPASTKPLSAPIADASGALIFTPEAFTEQRPNTALDMVNRVPGFVVNDGSGARGFEGAVGNILINGARPATKNDTGANILSRTPASRVEHIELIRGGAPGVDMQGYGMVVNVVLKTAPSRQSVLTWNALLFDGGHDTYGASYRFTDSAGPRTWGVTLSDGISSNDSNGEARLIRRAADGRVLRDEHYENDGWGGSRGLRGNYAAPLAGGKIDATARYGVEDWHEWTRQTSSTALRQSAYVETIRTGELGLTWTRPLAPGWALETRAIHEFEHFNEVSSSDETLNGAADAQQRFTAKGHSGESILRALARNERAGGLTLEAGGEVAYNMLDTRQAFTIGGAPVALPSATVKVEETRSEVFSKATWRATPRLSLEGGLRLESSVLKQSGDANQEKRFFYAKPRLLLTWTPSAAAQWAFRFERELGQLDFDDFAASADLSNNTVYGGNVNLRPEQRWISELTYERRFWDQGVVAVGYRHDRIIGVIDGLPLADGLSATGNIGDGTLDRLSMNIVVPLDRLRVPGGRFTFTNNWNKTRVTDPTTGKARPISDVRPTKANLGFSQDLPRWKTQWGINWLPLTGKRSYEPDQISGWRGTNYYEAFVEYKPSPTLSLRTELTAWDDFTYHREVYADRATRAIAFTEDRPTRPRTFLSFQARRTF